ncbi:MAG: hypothetical protein JWP51_2157 [Bradyrhizobium sp.]|nr:hypothetical protein [Bradyrhizobium sp.]
MMEPSAAPKICCGVKASMPSFSIVVRAAVAFIVTITLVDTAHAADAACKTAARHLVTLIKNNWPSSNENTPAATIDMV